jgi:hypothetical protein
VHSCIVCVCSARECVPVLNHAESPATAIEKRAFRVCTLGKDCRAKGVELDTKERREREHQKNRNIFHQSHFCPATQLIGKQHIGATQFILLVRNFEAHCYNIGDELYLTSEIETLHID